jgi:hypothetical protein
MMQHPAGPGRTLKRQFVGYSPYQEALWQALADTYYASIYGFSQTRMPTPGLAFDRDKFEAWQKKCVTAWDNEHHRMPGSGSPGLDDLPEHLWLYLYERMLAAPSHLRTAQC